MPDIGAILSVQSSDSAGCSTLLHDADGQCVVASLLGRGFKQRVPLSGDELSREEASSGSLDGDGTNSPVSQNLLLAVQNGLHSLFDIVAEGFELAEGPPVAMVVARVDVVVGGAVGQV